MPSQWDVIVSDHIYMVLETALRTDLGKNAGIVGFRKKPERKSLRFCLLGPENHDDGGKPVLFDH